MDINIPFVIHGFWASLRAFLLMFLNGACLSNYKNNDGPFRSVFNQQKVFKKPLHCTSAVRNSFCTHIRPTITIHMSNHVAILKQWPKKE